MSNQTSHAVDAELVGPGLMDSDNLNRAVKMALDTGEVATVRQGYELFHSYRLCVTIGLEVVDSAPHQAALLTIVNAGRRSLLGGVIVAGNLCVPLRLCIPGCETVADAVKKLGGTITSHVPDSVPLLVLGEALPGVEIAGRASSLSVTFDGWRGGVIPTCDKRRLAERTTIIPAAVMAGAIGVAEVFQQLRGNPMAGRRTVGLSLWNLGEIAWETAQDGPLSIVLPSRLWLLGLGHLGQAYLWILGLLPYSRPSEVELVLQDFDELSIANESTSLLTTRSLVGQRKTRAMAAWAEERGFRTRLVERRFPGGITVSDDEPRLALGGVDNPLARTSYEDAGFDCIIDAGLGTGPQEYLALRLNCFPGSTTARKKWGGTDALKGISIPKARAYHQLAVDGADSCGLVRLANRSVGAPFVGATTAALVISEAVRRLNNGPALEVLDMTLRDPTTRVAVPASVIPQRFNPGYTK